MSEPDAKYVERVDNMITELHYVPSQFVTMAALVMKAISNKFMEEDSKNLPESAIVAIDVLVATLLNVTSKMHESQKLLRDQVVVLTAKVARLEGLKNEPSQTLYHNASKTSHRAVTQ